MQTVCVTFLIFKANNANSGLVLIGFFTKLTTPEQLSAVAYTTNSRYRYSCFFYTLIFPRLSPFDIDKLPEMPNFFREVLGPLIFGNNRRDKLRIINWLQQRRLLKRSVNCANCRHPMRLKAHRQNGDGYIW